MEGGRNIMTIEYKDSKRIVATSADLAVVSSRGTVTTSGSDTIITFTGNGTFTPTSAFNVQYLVVAGGGGGGAGGAGGGGAGGFKTATGFAVTSQNYDITVGAGGAGGGISTNENGIKGSDSIFSTITSEGGGYGGGDTGAGDGGDGGSGGGGAKDAGNGNNKGLGTAGQGYDGGHGATTGGYQGSGGGGGSSVIGNDGNANAGGNGGAGTANPISGSTAGVSGYLGGGGGGSGSGGNGSGGSGGGGAGTWTGNVTGVAGTVNTGSGGGGGGEITINNGGGAGGSGIVILKFVTSGNTYSTSAGGKPTDVEDNSILVEKDTAKRYWFDSGSSETTPTYTGWAVSGGITYHSMDSANSEIDFKADRNTAGDRGISKSVGTLNSDTWVARFQLDIDTINRPDGGGLYETFSLNAVDSSVVEQSGNTFIGLALQSSSSEAYFKAVHGVNAGNHGNQVTIGSNGSFVTGTYYVEITRLSATSATVKVFTGSDYSTGQIGNTATLSLGGSHTTDLQYFTSKTNSGGADNNYVLGSFKELKIYDGVTSVTPATWTKDRQVTSDSALCSGGKSTDGGSPTTNTQASSDGVWANITAISTARQMPHGIGNANNFTIAGGYNGVNDSQTWNGTSWATAIPINTQRRDTSAIAGSYDDCVVACGRNTAGTLLNTASKFDGTTWSATSSNANTAREHPCGSGQADSMLVAGGYGASATSDAVDSYDGTTFTNGTALPNAVYGSNMAASANDSAHITGGYSGGGSTPYSGTYDGSTWTDTGQYPVSTAHYFGGGGGDRDEHLVMGGYNANVTPYAYYDTTYLWNGTSWVAKNDITEDKAQGAGDCTAR